MTQRYCLTLDLKNDPQLIAEYEWHHKNVWPDVLQSLRDAGIINMEIYRYQNHLYMIIDADETFSFERKAAADAANEKVQEWEAAMAKYQDALPGAQPGEKWKLADKVFSLR
ncbi:MAG TPA: L-rhamnose mutarotase [Chitinophagaceae bacterium]|nr:L-rhamnose mutarotase [Chitinophagaceae bacterium]